jgi:photosystem II stability/assembly factor-like uncharacterized protein
VISGHDLEARLRRYARDFDDQVLTRPDFERRVMARLSAQPIPPVKRRSPIIRELALAALVALLVGTLSFGVIQLRGIRQATAVKSPTPSAAPSVSPTATPVPTLGPTLSYTPGLRLPPGPIDIGSTFTGPAIKMLTPFRGWAIGPPGKDRNQVHDAVLVTADGGAHWRNVTPPGFAGWTDRTMYFLDLAHAWVAVTQHVVAHPSSTPATITVFRTSDGAQSWQSATFQLADGSPSQLDFVDLDHGWMVLQIDNGVAIYRTHDGGVHWEQASVSHYTQPNGTASGVLPMSNAFGPDRANQLSCQLDPFNAISFRDASTGWAAGSCIGPGATAYFYVTHDAGSTWQSQPLPSGPATPECPCFIRSTGPAFTSSRDATVTVAFDAYKTSCQPQNGGTACGSTSIPGTGVVYATHDGGATWAAHVLPGVASGAEPTFIDARTGWYAASIPKSAPSFPGETTFDNLYMTTDGGASWRSVGLASGFSGGEMDFVTSNVGWALSSLVDFKPSLLMTTDGGRTWIELHPAVIG